MGELERRVMRLEATIAPDVAERCRTCGLEHARKVSIDEVRTLVRVIGGTSLPAPMTVQPGPFCLCSCCAHYRGLAELTHQERGAA